MAAYVPEAGDDVAFTPTVAAYAIHAAEAGAVVVVVAAAVAAYAIDAAEAGATAPGADVVFAAAMPVHAVDAVDTAEAGAVVADVAAAVAAYVAEAEDDVAFAPTVAAYTIDVAEGRAAAPGADDVFAAAAIDGAEGGPLITDAITGEFGGTLIRSSLDDSCSVLTSISIEESSINSSISMQITRSMKR